MLKLFEKQQHVNHSTSETKTGELINNGTSFKKCLLLALCIFAISSTCFAQDIIVTKESKKINAKVTRVDLDKVTYKNFDDQEGASHTILRRDVVSILYEDGEVETFGQDTKAAVKSQTATPVEKQKTLKANNNSSNNYSNSKSATAPKNQEAVATEDVSKTRWGIKGGLNFATIVLSNGSKSLSVESVAGAVAGVTIEHSFTPEWFFHSGLEVSMKGFNSDIKPTAFYVLLPAAAGYKFDIGKGWKLEPRAGLYVAYGIGGSATAKGYSGSIKTFGDKVLNTFDCGFLGGCFFSTGSIVIGIHGETGFADAKGDNLILSGGAKNARTSNVSITLGYLF